VATFRVTTASGKTTTVVADDDYQVRKKLALKISRKGKVPYATAWRAVSPSQNPSLKIERISDRTVR
jgi:hypothetical protein